MMETCGSSGNGPPVVDQFRRAIEFVTRSVPRDVGHERKMDFYGCFKQATSGDLRLPRPSEDGLDLEKWNAWSSYFGWSREKAMREYVRLLDESVSGWENWEGFTSDRSSSSSSGGSDLSSSMNLPSGGRSLEGMPRQRRKQGTLLPRVRSRTSLDAGLGLKAMEEENVERIRRFENERAQRDLLVASLEDASSGSNFIQLSPSVSYNSDSYLFERNDNAFQTGSIPKGADMESVTFPQWVVSPSQAVSTELPATMGSMTFSESEKVSSSTLQASQDQKKILIDPREASPGSQYLRWLHSNCYRLRSSRKKLIHLKRVADEIKMNDMIQLATLSRLRDYLLRFHERMDLIDCDVRRMHNATFFPSESKDSKSIPSSLFEMSVGDERNGKNESDNVESELSVMSRSCSESKPLRISLLVPRVSRSFLRWSDPLSISSILGYSGWDISHESWFIFLVIPIAFITLAFCSEIFERWRLHSLSRARRFGRNASHLPSEDLSGWRRYLSEFKNEMQPSIDFSSDILADDGSDA